MFVEHLSPFKIRFKKSYCKMSMCLIFLLLSMTFLISIMFINFEFFKVCFFFKVYGMLTLKCSINNVMEA